MELVDLASTVRFRIDRGALGATDVTITVLETTQEWAAVRWKAGIPS